MAKSKDIFGLRGSIGKLTFYKGANGTIVRAKGGVSRNKIKYGREFELTRKNMAEFGRAAQAGKLFRRAFNSLVRLAADKGTSGRLTAVMRKIIDEDLVNKRGERTVSQGDARLLERFQLNNDCALGRKLDAEYYASIDRATGAMTIDVPAFSPAQMISGPAGATHFRLLIAGAAIDFDEGSFEKATSESDYLPMKAKEQQAIQLMVKVAPGSPHSLFLLLGIEFVQRVQAENYPLTGHSAVQVVRAAGASRES